MSHEDLAHKIDSDMLAYAENSFLGAQARYAATVRPRPQYGYQQHNRAASRFDANAAALFAEAHEPVFDWIRANPTNNFARSLSTYFKNNGFLTGPQLAAVNKTLCATAQRELAAEQPAGTQLPRAPAVDLRNVPSGRYAVPGGATRLKVQIDNVTEGTWNGWIFAKDAAEYGHGKRYGRQPPGAPAYDGDIKDELRVIAQNPKAASAAYGRLVGRCGICNRKLEDEESVARGIGPICAGKMGW